MILLTVVVFAEYTSRGGPRQISDSMTGEEAVFSGSLWRWCVRFPEARGTLRAACAGGIPKRYCLSRRSGACPGRLQGSPTRGKAFAPAACPVILPLHRREGRTPDPAFLTIFSSYGTKVRQVAFARSGQAALQGLDLPRAFSACSAAAGGKERRQASMRSPYSKLPAVPA